MKFLSLEAGFISIMYHTSFHHFHVRTGSGRASYLVMLDKLQKLVFGAAGPTFAASLELLAHHRNVAV